MTPPPPRLLPALRRLLYFGLPAVIAAILYKYIDWPGFFTACRSFNPLPLALGLLMFPLAIAVSAVRWRRLLGRAEGRPVPFAFTLRHAFAGLVAGLVTPGAAGWDVYRAVVGARVFGGYGVNTAVILVEKAASLFATAALIGLLYPKVAADIQLEGEALRAVVLAGRAALAVAGVIAAAALVLRHRLVAALLDRLARYGERLLTGMRKEGGAADGLRRGLDRLARGLPPVEAMGWSALSLAVSAAGHYFLLRAGGWPQPFWVPLFAVPVMTLLLALPLSIGGLGVREVLIVLLYGIFGVPAEAALAVGLAGLGGVALTQVIGGLTLWRCGMAAAAASASGTSEEEKEIVRERG